MQVWQQVQVQPFFLGFSLSPPEGGRNTGGDSVSRPARGAVKNTRGAVPENVVVAVQQALVGCVQEPASGLKVLGVKHPTGENSSGQTCLGKDGSVQLQWAPGTKTAALAQVPVGPDGRRVCWAEWCWVPCDRLSCPHWHGSEDPEALTKIVPAVFSLGVCALACERLGLKDRFPGLKRFPNMGDLFQAQLWLRAVLASSYRL